MAELFKKAYNKLAKEIAPNNPQFQLRELTDEELAQKAEQKRQEKAEYKAYAEKYKKQKPEKNKPVKQREAEHGKKLASELIQDGIGLIRVTVYEDGYVRIGDQIEKLVSVSGDAQISQKTGLGRSVATVATMFTPFPAFNLLSPNARGRAALSFVTDKQVKVISTTYVDKSVLDKFEKLRAAAAAAILANTPLESESSSPANDLGQQLQQLGELHQKGILTDEEFATAKAKLIG